MGNLVLHKNDIQIRYPIKLRMKDHVGTREAGLGGIGGYIIFGRGRHTVEYTDPYGNKATRTEFEHVDAIQPNIVPIGGYQFVFDKMFNIGHDQESTLRVGHLNDESPQMKIGVPRDRYLSTYYTGETSEDGSVTNNYGVNISALDYIFGFMIGDGGAKEDNITAIAPNYKNRCLYNPIPFRMSNDGYSMPDATYFGKATSYQGDIGSDPIDSYYIKRFDTPDPRIVHVWVTDNTDEFSVVDDTVFASTSSLSIESYVEINISIDAKDARGYSTTTGSTCRINEIGLVSGWYNVKENDYENLTMITHFVRSSINLSEGDSIEAIYRLYAR
jgi:hypothetical protein